MYVFLALDNLQNAKNPFVYQLVYVSTYTDRRTFFVLLFTNLDIIYKSNQHKNPLSLKEEYFTLRIKQKSDFPKQTAITILDELHQLKVNRPAV
jgi:hypothetical protein